MAANNTSFKKGQGGRKPGSANKATTDLRKWVNRFIESQTDQIQNDWKQLEPKDRIILFEKLLKYSLPTLQAVSADVNFEQLTDQQLDYIIENLKQ